MDYEYLKASDGTGNAVLAHITESRSVGSPLLKIDNTDNIPDYFIGTTGAVGSDGFLVPGGVQEFLAHLDGNDVIIDEFEPGHTDLGNSAEEVLIIKQTTGWANRVANFIQQRENSVAQFVDPTTEKPVSFVVSDTQPTADPDHIIIWFEPLS